MANTTEKAGFTVTRRPIYFIFTLGVLLGMALAIAMSCTPEEVAAFKTLSPDDQGRVLAALGAPEGHSGGGDCYTALHHFPGDHATARRIIHRESRNNPAAQNSRSSAAGCYQLLSMHAWRFDAVGCSWAQRYNAVCNTKAAAHLYRQAGWTPWRI